MKSRTHVNAFFSFSQVIITSLVLFITYKYLLGYLGAEKLGIWALIVASVSVLNIGSLGLSSTLVKYIAKYSALNNQDKIYSIIHTSLISVFVISLFMVFIIFFLSTILLELIIPAENLSLAYSLLPYSLLNVIVLMLAGIPLSAIDGAQKIYIRNLLLIVTSILFLIMVFYLVPRYFLLGIVYAQLIQSILTLLLAWFLLQRIFPFLPLLPKRWDWDTLREIFGYGASIQLISIFNMLYEPVTKSFLTIFGGLAAVGYYEMANRLVLKIRELISSVFQVLVPVYASQFEVDFDKIKTTYFKSLNYSLFLSITLFALLIISAPLISILWLGFFEFQFFIFTILLLCAWFINVFNAPAYFAFLGIGLLRWNLISHITIGILNLILSYILGTLYGGIGTVIGWCIALSFGSMVISYKFNSINRLKFLSSITKENKVLLIISIILITAISISNYIFASSQDQLFINLGSIVLFILALFYFIWAHPVRRDLFTAVKLFLSLK